MPDQDGSAGIAGERAEATSFADASAADVLLDRVQLGLELLLPVPVRSAPKFCGSLARAGFLARAPRAGAILGRELAIGPAAIVLPDGATAILDGRLELVASKNGMLQIRRTSTLLPGLMRALRTVRSSPPAAGPGGQDNIAAFHDDGEYEALLAWQLRAVAGAVDAFVAALAMAAGVGPELLGGRVWVQQAEFCRDYRYEEAEAFVRRLRDRPIRGGRHERVRSFSDQLGNGLSVSWDEGAKKSPERKVYAKTPELVRVELSLRNRSAVTAMLGRVGAPRGGSSLLGAGVAGELALLARGAAPLLDDALLALNEGLTAVPRTGADFVLAFAPLVRLACPPRRKAGAAGRPRGAGVEPRARLVLERLLAEGKFDMRGCRPSDAVLLALKEMEAAGALMTTKQRPRLFTTAPELERARQTLADMPTEPMGGGDGGEGA